MKTRHKETMGNREIKRESRNAQSWDRWKSDPVISFIIKFRDHEQDLNALCFWRWWFQGGSHHRGPTSHSELPLK